MEEFVLSEVRGPVGILTLNRPEVLNAWNAPMRARLVEALDELEENEAVRAIILTGAGDRAFGAGQDLNETKTFDPDRAEQWIGEWERLYDRIRSLSKPIIAALNGVAAGSAFQVALLCDLRIGHDGRAPWASRRSTPASPRTTGPWIMRELIGLARTIDLTLTGRMMDARGMLPDRRHQPPRAEGQGDGGSARACQRTCRASRLSPCASNRAALPRGDRGRFPRLPCSRHPQPARSLRHRRAGPDDGSSSWPKRARAKKRLTDDAQRSHHGEMAGKPREGEMTMTEQDDKIRTDATCCNSAAARPRRAARARRLIGRAGAATQITVADPGGPFGPAFRKAFYDPFEKATGNKVVNVAREAEPTAQFKAMVETQVLHLGRLHADALGARHPRGAEPARADRLLRMPTCRRLMPEAISPSSGWAPTSIRPSSPTAPSA